jgi:hypothetical protein
MKNRIVSVLLLLVFLVALTTNDQAARAVSGGQPSLLYVEVCWQAPNRPVSASSRRQD